MLMSVFCLSQLCLNAQDARYSQYFAAPLKLNPAIMGANTDVKAIVNYRNQWGSISSGYSTYRFTFLYPLHMVENKSKLDIGLSAISDQAGVFTNTDVSLALSYNLLLSNSGHNLCAALLVGFVQKTIDLNDPGLTFDEQYVQGSFSASNSTGETILIEKVSYPDVGAGILWYYNPSSEESKINAFAGVSMYHLNTPNESFTGESGKLPMRLTSIAGIKIIGNGKIDFTPNIRIVTQSGAQEIATGLYMDYNLNENSKMAIGTWYKRKDAIALILGFDIKSFSLGYSYDLGSSELNNVISGGNAHEITLAFKVNRAEKKNININPSLFSNF